MGQDWRPNKALSTELILSYLRQIQLKVVEAETLREENRWLVLAVYSVITYVVSLRGLEGFLLDLGGLRLHTINDNKRSKYFLILLMGKVKGECHHRCHLLTCCLLTAMDIKPFDWIQKLTDAKKKQGLFDGPAISDKRGRVLTLTIINQGMHDVL
jgi:hypothetical protein